MPDPAWFAENSWDVERREDGAVIVRVHSRRCPDQPLPDAVFAFRSGDPQFLFWESMLEGHRSAS